MLRKLIHSKETERYVANEPVADTRPTAAHGEKAYAGRVTNLTPLEFWTTEQNATRHRVNDLITAAQRAERSNEELCARVRNLADVGTAHAYEIARLQVVVFALMEVLVESGADKVALDARIAAALKRLDPQSNAPPETHGPYR